MTKAANAKEERDRLDEAGSEIPTDLYPPEIMSGYEEWLWAFFELSNDRQIGMSIGPIPSSSIINWCDGWDYDDAVAFRTCIRAMDAVYLEQSKTDKPKVPEKQMGPEMFDAMFG